MAICIARLSLLEQATPHQVTETRQELPSGLLRTPDVPCRCAATTFPTQLSAPRML